MDAHSKFNPSWLLTALAWILSAVLVPFIPEIMSGGKLLGYPLMEYLATIGLFAGILLLVWIPAGFRISKLYKAFSLKRACFAILKVFVIQLLIFTVIFKFFWNS
jgi:hypothetical protein